MSLSRQSWPTLLIAAAAAALYWPSLHHPVFFDDIRLFNLNGLNNIFMAGPAFEIRWLPYFVTAWIDLIFDDKIFAQRLINVGLHLLTGFVLYALIRQVSDRAAPHHNNQRAAMAAALLFLMHPLAVYAVGYLAQRTILMATLFGLLSLSAYFDGVVTRKKAYFVLSALFYLLSSFSKEHAVLIPAAALALTPLAGPITRQSWRPLILPLALFLAIAALVAAKARGVVGQAYEPFAEQLLNQSGLNASPLALWLLSALTQAVLFFKYLALMLFPNPGWMSIDMRPAFATQLWQPEYWCGALALLAYGVAAIVLLIKGGRRGLAGYALLAPLLLFAVEFSSVRIQEPFVLYRAYLWLPLLMLLIPALTPAVSDKLFWALALTIAGAFAVASTDRLNSFANGYALWDDAVKKLPNAMAPGAFRAYSTRCQQNLHKGNHDAAIADCTRALQAYPDYRPAVQMRAFAYMKRGDFQAAIRDAQSVVDRHPDDPHVHGLLGAVYLGAGQFDKARVSFEIACERRSIAACAELDAMKAKAAADPR
jgi:protein O-mannosyl-transferase